MSRAVRTKLYWVWGDMVGRCTNPNHPAWANYGGRGVWVCDRWRKSTNFLADMSPRPDGATLDRIDNDGPYSPENCRWASRQEQNSNRRNCIYVDCDGERVTLKEYCRRKDIPYRPINKRVSTHGWPLNAAITLPLGSSWKRSANRER